MNYDELSSLGKMAYARYRDTPPTITADQVQALTRLTTTEKNFILGIIQKNFKHPILYIYIMSLLVHVNSMDNIMLDHHGQLMYDTYHLLLHTYMYNDHQNSNHPTYTLQIYS